MIYVLKHVDFKVIFSLHFVVSIYSDLPPWIKTVHIILGNSECHRISTTKPQRVGREWYPVASYTKLGWIITSPGREIDTTSILLTQTSRVDHEELCKINVLGLTDSPSGDQGVVYDEFTTQLRRSEEG